MVKNLKKKKKTNLRSRPWSIGEDVELLEFSHSWWEYEFVNELFWKQCGSFL